MSFFRRTDKLTKGFDNHGKRPTGTPNLGCKISFDGSGAVLRHVFGGKHVGCKGEFGDP